jgi:hypothetical protein
MSLMDELQRNLYIGQYNTLTFYNGEIPILTLRIINKNEILLITNNMQELNAHVIQWNGNLNEFANDIYNYLIDDEINIERTDSLRFFDGLFIEGRIEKDKIIVTLPDGEGKDVEIVINNRDGLSELTIAEILSVFVYQYFS